MKTNNKALPQSAAIAPEERAKVKKLNNMKVFNQAVKSVDDWLDQSDDHHALVILVDGKTGASMTLNSHCMAGGLTPKEIRQASPITEAHHLMMATCLAELIPDMAIDIEYMLAMLCLGEKDLPTVVTKEAYALLPEWLKQQYVNIEPLWCDLPTPSSQVPSPSSTAASKSSQL